jgi:glycosyltransferase involved in cell wall biosynthesis
VIAVKVSVVVPVCNPGPYLEPCVSSLLRQSLDCYEVIFVDDGSSDGSAERLDEVAGDHPWVRVIHTDRSGGPGRPRNLGIEAARGEYLYFLDDDDWLGDQALERMYAMARRADSDIVIGKMVGQGRTVPRAIFRHNRERADILDDHLLRMMTPHKLFRAALIDKHHLRFPEGNVRLEDHRFVLAAYFKAKVISVLADYPCCYWVRRDDGTNYSSNHVDPAAYYANLREVLDLVDEHIPPGETRDRYYAHWYRAKMLKLVLSGMRTLAPTYVWRRYMQLRQLALERFSPEVDRWLTAAMRVRSALLRADAKSDLQRLVWAEHRVAIRPYLENLHWDGDELVISVAARMTDAFGGTVGWRRRQDGGHDRLVWTPPIPLATPLPEEAVDVTDEARAARLDVLVRNRKNRAAYFLPIEYTRQEPPVLDPAGPGDAVQVAFTGRARLDVNAAQLGRPLTRGKWDLIVRIESCGWAAERRLGPGRTAGADRACVAGHPHDRLVVPYWTDNGNLSIHVEPRSPAHVIAAAIPAASVDRIPGRARQADRARLVVPLPDNPNGQVSLRLTRQRGVLARLPERVITAPAAFEPPRPGSAPHGSPRAPDRPYGRLVADIPLGGQHRISAGRWHIDVDAGRQVGAYGAVLHVSWTRRVSLRPACLDAPPPPAERLRRVARRIPWSRRIVRSLRALRQPARGAAHR